MTRAPKVDLDQVVEKGTALGLAHAADCLPELVEEGTRDGFPPLRFLDLVLEREIEWKTERRIATSLKLSGLPTGRTLEGFDWTFQPRVDRSRLEALATCAFIRQRENVLFLGPPGVGKSHLGVALGVKAIKNGFSTTHFVLDDLMHQLRRTPRCRRHASRPSAISTVLCSLSTKSASDRSTDTRPTSSSVS
jgi:DNA replication protein DnaC